MAANEIKREWDRILANPPKNYYGMPHAKLLVLGLNRRMRSKWPIVGDGTEVKERIYNLRKNAEAGSLPRLWAVGYEDGWVVDRSRLSAVPDLLTIEQEETTPSPRRARAKSNKPLPAVEVVVPARKAYSRVPTDTEDDEGLTTTQIYSRLVSDSDFIERLSSTQRRKPRSVPSTSRASSDHEDDVQPPPSTVASRAQSNEPTGWSDLEFPDAVLQNPSQAGPSARHTTTEAVDTLSTSLEITRLQVKSSAPSPSNIC